MSGVAKDGGIFDARILAIAKHRRQLSLVGCISLYVPQTLVSGVGDRSCNYCLQVDHYSFNRVSAVYANWCQHTAHAKARFAPIGTNIPAATFSASTFEIWNAEKGKFDNVSYTPLAVAISKK